MIKFTYRDLNHSLTEALAEVQKIPLPIKASYTIGKIFEKANQIIDRARTEHQALAKEFCYLNEDGSLKSFPEEAVTDPTGKPMVEPKTGTPLMKPAEPFRFMPEKKEAYEAAMTKFFETTVELEYNKIPIESFGSNVELTPECVRALEPILGMEKLRAV